MLDSLIQYLIAKNMRMQTIYALNMQMLVLMRGADLQEGAFINLLLY
jgi:hypothetical protein